MATIIDGKEWIFELLRSKKTEGNININGEIYIDKKPYSDREDIVINSLVMDNTLFQEGTFNVNCYVPDLVVNLQGKTITMPDRARLKAITNEVYPILFEKVKKQKYIIKLEWIQQLREETEQSTYINFRVRINAKNENFYKNY